MNNERIERLAEVDRLVEFIRHGMYGVKLPDRATPDEITVKVVYDGATVTNTFKISEGKK